MITDLLLNIPTLIYDWTIGWLPNAGDMTIAGESVISNFTSVVYIVSQTLSALPFFRTLMPYLWMIMAIELAFFSLRAIIWLVRFWRS